MSPRSLNPNHPVTQALDDHWYKILAVVLHKYRDDLPDDVFVGPEDIRAFVDDGLCHIVAAEKDDVIHLRIVGEAEAQRLAREAGGQPN